MPSRLLVGNLDAEHRLAGEEITRAARDTASALATLLRVFASGDQDRLWIPEPVDPERVPELPGLPRPELISGDWDHLEPCAQVLAWAEVPGVAALRSTPLGPAETVPSPLGDQPLHELLWRIPPPDPQVVKRVMHRGFHLRVARELGVALPGARVIRSIEELERHLAQGGAAPSPSGGWVGKAPWSAAGRSRVIEPSAAGETSSLLEAVLSGSARRRAEKLLARHGELLFEPWMDRLADFGCTGVVTGEGAGMDAASVRCHRLEVDPEGRFQGIELDPTDAGRPGGRLLQETALQVAGALRDAGYRGPFGIDAYLHRDREGREELHPLSEINARLTFGHVARALAERLAPGRRVRLTVARQPPEEGEEESMALLRPGDGSLGAWVTVRSSGAVF